VSRKKPTRLARATTEVLKERKKPVPKKPLLEPVPSGHLAAGGWINHDRPGSIAKGQKRGNLTTALRARPVETPALNWVAPKKGRKK
jgi:hypothetical protein